MAANAVAFLLFLWPCRSESTEPAYRETLLSVSIDGELVAENALLLESEDGLLSARTADLLDWRLQAPPGSPFLFEGEEFAPLDAFPGLSYRVDLALLELDIEAPPGLFDRTILFGRFRQRVTPRGGTGAFLNYDFILNAGDGIKPDMSGVLEAVGFRSQDLGAIETNVLARDLDDRGRLTRLDSTWTKDLIDRRETIRAGDSFTGASALGSPVRFGGVQWATNFAVDPSFVHLPTESIAGLAERPSVVEVFVNDVLRSTRDVPRGPFQIDQVPTFSGQGEVRYIASR